MKINISKRTVKILLAFACLYFIWGSTYMAIKFAIDTMPPFLMASSRFLAAGLILFGISRVKSDEKIEYKHWKSAFITGGLLLLGGNGGVVYAELYLPSGITALLISAVPIWFVILNWLLPKGEKPTVRTIIGVLVGFSGMYYLIQPFNGETQDINLIGVGSLMLATFLWALGSVYSGKIDIPRSKLTAAGMQMIGGGVLLLLFSLVTGDFFKFDPAAVTTKSLVSLVYLFIFGSMVAYTAYIWLLDTVGSALTATYAYVNPVIAVFLGWIFAGEELNSRIILATLIIIASVAIISNPFRKSTKIIKDQN